MKESIFCHVLKVRAQVKSFNRIAWNRFFRPQFSFDIDNADIIPFVCIIFCCEHVLVNMARFVLQLCYIFGAWCFFLLFFSSSCFSISFHSSLLIWFNYEITVTHTEISTLLNLNRMSTRNAKSPELVHNYFIHFPFSVCAFSIFFHVPYVGCKARTSIANTGFLCLDFFQLEATPIEFTFCKSVRCIFHWKFICYFPCLM